MKKVYRAAVGSRGSATAPVFFTLQHVSLLGMLLIIILALVQIKDKLNDINRELKEVQYTVDQMKWKD